MNAKLKKGDKKRYLTVFMTIIVVIGIYTVFGEKGLIDLYKYKKDHGAVVSDNVRLEADNSELREEIDLLKDDKKYVEHIARQELGMVKEDEYIYKFE